MEIDNKSRCQETVHASTHTYQKRPLNHFRYPPLSMTSDSSLSACLALGLTARTETCGPNGPGNPLHGLDSISLHLRVPHIWPAALLEVGVIEVKGGVTVVCSPCKR